MVTLPEDFTMDSAPQPTGGLLPVDRALQHERAPRPLPLFLELLREVSKRDPKLAAAALAGLGAYEQAPRRERPAPRPQIAQVRGAALRDHGGDGPAVVLVPSLINPPRILDLDEQVSLTGAIARMGRRALLLDWGKANERSELDVAGHLEQLLLPLLEQLDEPPALLGYCLGGTMAIAAANVAKVERVATLAAPWHFRRYPEASHAALDAMWRHSKAAAKTLGALPMEVLQAAFWSLDPERTVAKFAEFGRLDPASDEARRFIELEEWANEGEALPYAAANELIEGLFENDLPGSGRWQVAEMAVSEAPPVPALHLAAERDRIAPASTAAAGEVVTIAAGHVGMIVGSARTRLHEALQAFLTPCR
jgi:polyhydroxyalkanoate synthase